MVSTRKRLDEYSRIMWVAFLALWFAYSLAHILLTSGCTPEAKRDIARFFSDVGQCAKYEAAGALTTVSQQLIDSIDQQVAQGNGFNSDQWKQVGINLGVTYGIDLVKCAASKLYVDIINKPSDMGSGSLKLGAKSYLVKPDYPQYLKAIF